MRIFEVDWFTFEFTVPKVGTRVVVDAGKGCVTGTVQRSYTGGKKRITVCIERKHGGLVHVPMASRWYLFGSERLKVAA